MRWPLPTLQGLSLFICGLGKWSDVGFEQIISVAKVVTIRVKDRPSPTSTHFERNRRTEKPGP